MIPRIVLDTNVIIAALRSNRGASFKLLSLAGTGKYELIISVPLILEYEDVAKRQSRAIGLAHRYIDDIVDYLCQVGDCRSIFFLWRPFLRDPKDDLVLELAVKAGCDYILTYNKRDFVGVERFNLGVLDAGEFLLRIGAVK